MGPRNFAGFTTALPSPEEVLNYAGRQSDWGPRVRLRKLTIVDGVATADFSKEMAAYGGGSARVNAIQEQVTLTLKQFPSVKEVRILVDGKPDALQP
jgi:spore germination protein GerM